MNHRNSAAAIRLLPSTKLVVFHEEIEQMRSLLFKARVNVFPVEALHDRAERALQAGILFTAEQGGSAELLPHLADDAQSLVVFDTDSRRSGELERANPLVVIVVQGVQRPLVVGHHAQQRPRLVRGDVMPVENLSHQPKGLAQFSQPPFVDGVALNNMVAQNLRSPRCETACRAWNSRDSRRR